MGRLWLALAFIAALAGSAAAKPFCAYATDITLPRPGSTDVPTNARFWHIPASGITSTPDQPIQVYELAPHTTYELNSPRLSFTTGDGPDDTPPMEPQLNRVVITLDHSESGGMHDIAFLRINGLFSSDTAVLELKLTTPAGTLTYYMTGANLTVCSPGMRLPPGNVDVSMVAYDVAGNASTPATFNTTTTVSTDDMPPAAGHEHHNHGTDYIVYALLAPFVLALAYVIGLALTANARASARKAVEATPLAITAAEALARTIRRRSAIGMAIVAGGTALSFRSEDVALIMLLASPVLLIAVIVDIVRWFAAGRALKLASYEGATATVCRDEVRITVGGQHATLRAAPRRVQRAKAAGVPRARI